MEDTYAYQLSFSNEAQRSPTKKASSPSLSSYRVFNTSCMPQPIYLTGPPTTNPAYPYPARNVLNPGTYPSPTSLMASNGRRPSHPEDSTRSSRRYDIPSCHRFVPQPTYIGSYSPTGYQAGLEIPPIQFQRKGGGAPYTVGEILKMRDMPDLVGGSDLVFGGHIDRVIKVKTIWPGYTRYATERRIPTTGGELTRSLLLVILANQIEEFARHIHNKNIHVEAEQEQRAVKWQHEECRNLWKDYVITCLQHRAGSTWEPEIYCPTK